MSIPDRAATRRSERRRPGAAAVHRLTAPVDRVKRTIVAAVSGDRPLVFAVLCTVVLGVVLLSGPTQNYLDSRARVEILQMQSDVLQQENSRLSERARALHDDDTIELLAREQQGFIRPGEVPYALVPPEVDRPRITAGRQQLQSAATPWYEATWLWLQGLFGVS